MLGALETLRQLNRDLPRERRAIAADPVVKRETDYFAGHISNIKTAAALVNDDRLFTFAMKAYGLSDMSYAKGFMRKMLEGGLKHSDSLANRLSDPRFRGFVAAFDFGDKGAAAVTDAGAKTIASYVEQTLEANAGRENPGAQLGLYFQRKAPGVRSSLAILADKALLQVVRTALDLPASTSATTIEQDAAAIDKKLKIADLADPAKLQRLVYRFATMWDLSNPASTSTYGDAAMALSSPAVNPGVSTDLLLSVQKRYRSV